MNVEPHGSFKSTIFLKIRFSANVTLIETKNKIQKNIEDYLGVNKIIYFTLDLLCETLTSLNSNITNFEKSVFTGNYIAN